MHRATGRLIVSTELALNGEADADEVAANGHGEDLIAEFCGQSEERRVALVLCRAVAL